MNLKRKPSLVQFLAGASVAAMGASAPLAMAQDATAGDETSDEILQDDSDVIIGHSRQLARCDEHQAQCCWRGRRDQR